MACLDEYTDQFADSRFVKVKEENPDHTAEDINLQPIEKDTPKNRNTAMSKHDNPQFPIPMHQFVRVLHLSWIEPFTGLFA